MKYSRRRVAILIFKEQEFHAGRVPRIDAEIRASARQRGSKRITFARHFSGLMDQDTGHGFAFQMSAAYSVMVRSVENLPEPATLRMAIRVHASGSAYSCSNR